MHKPTPEEFAEILKAHRKWRYGEEGGSRANLAGANLAGADLADANLAGADLADANLVDANLARANLVDANLAGANLARANIVDANLARANLVGAHLPAPTAVLAAYWRDLPDDLVRDLMRYDAACHPNPAAFDRWAAGGTCPYSGVKLDRAARFKERKGLWVPGDPPRPYDLMAALLDHACPGWGNGCTDDKRGPAR